MHKLIILLLIMLCSACAALPRAAIPNAPKNQTQAVVFDIDGTLTPHPLSIFEARPDAANAVRIFAKKGYKIIYLSARFKWFQAMIPGWLEKNGFPIDSLYLPQEEDNDSDYPDVFKRRILEDFSKHGWRVEYAYGDSHTDFVAYKLAKIPHFFGLIREGETECKPEGWQECLKGGWTEHLKFLMNEDSVPTVPAN